jgi:hypothetical protein
LCWASTPWCRLQNTEGICICNNHSSSEYSTLFASSSWAHSGIKIIQRPGSWFPRSSNALNANGDADMRLPFLSYSLMKMITGRLAGGIGGGVLVALLAESRLGTYWNGFCLWAARALYDEDY